MARIREILIKECQISGGKPLVVGVSGGADSLSLLAVLIELEVPLVAAHFDHHLRPDSSADAGAVAKMAAQFGVDFVLREADVRAAAKAKGLSIEAAARECRYTFLFEQARRIGAEAVAVGHTADDQVETILMHFLRGSGLDGLKGMSYRTILPSYSVDIPLIRPLLEVWRRETQAYCAEHGLKPLVDSTNEDKRYQRNRLRLELIPELEMYNSQIKQKLSTLGQVARDTLAGIDEIGEWIYQRCLVDAMPGKFAALHSDDLRGLPQGWQARILRRAVKSVRPDGGDVDFQALRRALRLARKSEETGSVDLAGNLKAIRIHGRFYIADQRYGIPTEEWPQMKAGQSLELAIPGIQQLEDGWQIRAEMRKYDGGPVVTDNSSEVWLDCDSLSLPLSIRSRQSGDRFQPIGMDGTIKLSDYFINKKIPQPAREAWPLVISGNEIAWVAGLHMSEKFRVTEATRKVICLELARGR